MTDMLTAALGYATEADWPVFPCVPNGKEPVGYLVPNGLKNATVNTETIRRWWTAVPNANVAVACGHPGPDVLDVDTKDGRDGMTLFDRARRAGLLKGAGAIVRTPSGGLHIWFRGTFQAQGAIGPKKALELKARGGYVLLPPSHVVSDEYGYAGQYELVERRQYADKVDFAAVRKLLTPPPPAASPPRRGRKGQAGDFSALTRWLEERPAGDRNHPLFWACRQALLQGADEHVLDDFRDAIVRAGHNPRHADATVLSAIKSVRGEA